MANYPVYPFGPDGTLPAGVAIVNDLITGGADKALSAQQGKVIGDYLFTSYIPVNLSALTLHSYSLGDNSVENKRWTVSTARHYAIPVTPGTKLQITVTSTETTGGFYGFFTAYDVPTANNSPVYYVQDTTRRWLNNGTLVVIVPETAAYLIICTKDGSAHNSTWTVSEVHDKEIDGDFIPTTDIVDDLTTGGSAKVLSAEQGKVLAEMIEDGQLIPSGLTQYAYTGARVRIDTETHHIARQTVATIASKTCQGGACYGDYLFLFTEGNDTCWLFNLRTNTLVQTISIPAEQRGFVSNCHCNTVNFGTKKYDAGDSFPLLYVSTGYAADNYTGALVYRVTESGGTYSLTLVQTLKMPTSPSSWTEFVIGENNDCYICYTAVRKIYRMNLPSVSDGDLTFNLDDAIEVYQFTPQPFTSSNQNRIYYRGKMYVVSGSAGAGLLFVLNMATQERETVISLADMGINSEPETCFLWDGHLCVAFRSNSGVVALYFD